MVDNATIASLIILQSEKIRQLTQALLWQDISTAPRDGTAILVMQNDWPGAENGVAETLNGHNTYVAAWWENEGEGGSWVCYMDQVSEPICP